MTLTLLIDFWKTGNDRHDRREGTQEERLFYRERVKNRPKQEILLRTAQNRPKTDKRESHTDMTELFCDKNPKTFQVFAGAESS